MSDSHPIITLLRGRGGLNEIFHFWIPPHLYVYNQNHPLHKQKPTIYGCRAMYTYIIWIYIYKHDNICIPGSPADQKFGLKWFSTNQTDSRNLVWGENSRLKWFRSIFTKTFNNLYWWKEIRHENFRFWDIGFAGETTILTKNVFFLTTQTVSFRASKLIHEEAMCCIKLDMLRSSLEAVSAQGWQPCCSKEKFMDHSPCPISTTVMFFQENSLTQ